MLQETPKFLFWEVRGRKWAPGSLKFLWITAVFTRQRKGAISLQVYEILVNSMISVNFMGNPWIPRNCMEFQKISVFHKSVTLHETFVFPRPNWWSSPMGLPKTGNYKDSTKLQKISRISWKFAKFSDFSRILGEINFGPLGGFLAAPRWKRWYSYRNIDGFEVPGTTQIT